MRTLALHWPQVFPKQLLLRDLPGEVDIICTHPMFGPDSGKGSWAGLNFMYDKVRIGADPRRQKRAEAFLKVSEPARRHPACLLLACLIACLGRAMHRPACTVLHAARLPCPALPAARIAMHTPCPLHVCKGGAAAAPACPNRCPLIHTLRMHSPERCLPARPAVCARTQFFREEGCNMVEMTCEEHDRQAASTQFITHTVGRVLGAMELKPTDINTKGFDALLNLVNNTTNDSFELYYGLFLYNQNATDELERLEKAFDTVKKQLFGRLHDIARAQLFPDEGPSTPEAQVMPAERMLTSGAPKLALPPQTVSVSAEPAPAKVIDVRL